MSGALIYDGVCPGCKREVVTDEAMKCPDCGFDIWHWVRQRLP